MRRPHSCHRISLTVAFVLAASVLATPAGAPQASMKAYFASNFTDAAYQQSAVNAVLKAWKPAPPLPAGKKTVVISTIARDGKVAETRFNLKSGSDPFDQSALQAVKTAALPPLPKAFPANSVEVHWHFEALK